MTLKLPVNDLIPGMVIVRVTQQNGPVEIRKSGLVTSLAMVQGLTEMGVQEVEIDPAQTVEIAKDAQPSHQVTPTQALIRGHRDSSHSSSDKALSEQFNRSVFLPTVQGIPSAWHNAGKRVSLVLFLIIVGGGLGYAVAKFQSVAEQWVRVVPDESPVLPAAENDAKIAATNAPIAQTEQTATPVEELESNTEMPITTALDTESEPSGDSEQQGKMLTGRSNETADVSVSPELLAKFNKAVEDLDKQQDDPNALRDTVVTVHNDIQRVDQLPVRLLTQLPSMTFSAHMYASNSRDRWVRVNGKEKGEGDWIDDEVQIVNIEAQRVILTFRGEVFTMAALTDW